MSRAKQWALYISLGMIAAATALVITTEEKEEAQQYLVIQSGYYLYTKSNTLKEADILAYHTKDEEKEPTNMSSWSDEEERFARSLHWCLEIPGDNDRVLYRCLAPIAVIDDLKEYTELTYLGEFRKDIVVDISDFLNKDKIFKKQFYGIGE